MPAPHPHPHSGLHHDFKPSFPFPRRGGVCRGRPARSRRRAGPGLPDPARDHGRALLARRGQRHRRAHAGAEAVREVGPAGGRREQARRRRHGGRRGGGQGRAGRLHPAGGQHRHAGHQRLALQEDGLRPGQRLRAGQPDRRAAAGGAGQRGGAGEDAAGTGGLRQGTTRRGVVQQLGRRQLAAPGGRAVPEPEWRRSCCTCPTRAAARPWPT